MPEQPHNRAAPYCKLDPLKFELYYTSAKHGNFYTAIDPNSYHLSRYVAAGVQNIYSGAGTTAEYLDSITNQMLEIINNGSTIRIISDMAVLVNNIRYRLKYPVDAEAALRMGCIYLIHEDEDPFEMNPSWVTKKLKMIEDDAELYEKFFFVGVTHTPSWKEPLKDLGEMQTYLTNRQSALTSLTIQ